MGTDDPPADPERDESARTFSERDDAQEAQAHPTDDSTRLTEAGASADDPFDRLRAELRRSEAEEGGWRHRWPWRWLTRRRRDLDGDRRP